MSCDLPKATVEITFRRPFGRSFIDAAKDSASTTRSESSTHRFKKARVQSGFFFLEGAENISALILNPSGTLSKFNRMGAMTGFGDQTLKIVRHGYLRRDGDPVDPQPKRFRQEVGPGYDERWVEGMVVLHNPRAKRPLDPDLLPGANHEFLQQDGRIMSLVPDFHPWTSTTYVATPGDVLGEAYAMDDNT